MAKAKRDQICRFRSADTYGPAFVALRHPGGKGNCALAFFGESMEEAVALAEKYDPLSPLEKRFSKPCCDPDP